MEKIKPWGFDEKQKGVIVKRRLKIEKLQGITKNMINEKQKGEIVRMKKQNEGGLKRKQSKKLQNMPHITHGYMIKFQQTN